MFDVRRFRSDRSGVRRASQLALTAAAAGLLLVGAMGSPASAAGNETQTGTSAGGEGRRINIGTSAYPGQARGGSTLDESCDVERREGGRYYSHTIIIDGKIVNATTIVGFEEGLTPNIDADQDEVGDAAADAPDNSLTDEEPVTGDIKDGQLELDGTTFSVWVISDCDEYEESQQEIVVAPPRATGLLPFGAQLMEDVLPEPELELLPFDKANDWTYVQAAIDFRTSAASIDPITMTLDTGGPDFAPDGTRIRQWITMVATPVLVTFDSGDPLRRSGRLNVPRLKRSPRTMRRVLVRVRIVFVIRRRWLTVISSKLSWLSSGK